MWSRWRLKGLQPSKISSATVERVRIYGKAPQDSSHIFSPRGVRSNRRPDVVYIRSDLEHAILRSRSILVVCSQPPLKIIGSWNHWARQQCLWNMQILKSGETLESRVQNATSFAQSSRSRLILSLEISNAVEIMLSDRVHRSPSYGKARRRRKTSKEERVCAVCGQAFKKAEHLARHFRSHTKEKPFECHVCSKSFARQ